MSHATFEIPVGRLVVERPTRARVFERYGIDYCCGGKKPLAEACREKNLDPELIVHELRTEERDNPQAAAERDWSQASLSELADHIERTHHAYLKAELPRLDRLTRKVALAHCEAHPELVQLRKVFIHFKAELESHMADEEHVLFPLCRRIEAAKALPDALYGSLQNPIAELTHEHDEAGAALESMRRLTNSYVTPRGACNTYRAMLAALAELEADTHQHVHKENNILFPRAITLEAKLRG